MSQGDEPTEQHNTGTDTTDGQQVTQPGKQPETKDPWNKFKFDPHGNLGVVVDLVAEADTGNSGASG